MVSASENGKRWDIFMSKKIILDNSLEYLPEHRRRTTKLVYVHCLAEAFSPNPHHVTFLNTSSLAMFPLLEDR